MLFVAQNMGAREPKQNFIKKMKAAAALNNKGPVMLKSNLVSKTQTIPLAINEPTSANPIIANTTIPTQVDSSVARLLKSEVFTTLSFYCDSVLIAQINSTLGTTKDYFVPVDIKGECYFIATAPFNPEYSPSPPTDVQVLQPLYYEGALDNILYTGQTIDNFIRPADSSRIQVDFLINCTNGGQFQTVYWTNQSNFYTLTNSLLGQCTFSTPVVPNLYAPIEPFTVTIEPAITFVSPTEGEVIAAGSEIVAKLSSTNDGNPQVTVSLICNSVLFESKTQPLKTSFTFGPSEQIYGKCELTADTVEPYYTADTVQFNILSILSFKLPAPGQIVSSGSDYVVQVEGTSGTESVSVSVTAICEVGTFTDTVIIGKAKVFTMADNVEGKCSLTATANAPNFTPAITFLTVLKPLKPIVIAKILKTLVLSGRIFSITRPLSFYMGQ